MTNKQLNFSGLLSILGNGFLIPLAFILTLLLLRNYLLDEFSTTVIITTILLIKHGLSAHTFSILKKLLKFRIQFNDTNLSLEFVESFNVILVGFLLSFNFILSFYSPSDLDKTGNLVSALKIYIIAVIILTTLQLITGIIAYRLFLLEDFAFSLVIASSSAIILLLLWVSILTGETILNIYLIFIAVFCLVTEAVAHFLLGKVFFRVASNSS